MTSADETGGALVPPPVPHGPGSVLDPAAWDRVLRWLKADLGDSGAMRTAEVSVSADAWNNVTDDWRLMFCVHLDVGQDCIVESFYGYGDMIDQAAEEALSHLLQRHPAPTINEGDETVNTLVQG